MMQNDARQQAVLQKNLVRLSLFFFSLNLCEKFLVATCEPMSEEIASAVHIRRAFDLHAGMSAERQRLLQSNSNTIRCATVTSTTTSGDVDGDEGEGYSLLWCSYADGTVVVTDMDAALRVASEASARRRRQGHDLPDDGDHHHHDDSTSSPDGEVVAHTKAVFALRFGGQGPSAYHRDEAFAVQLISFPSGGGRTPRVLAVDSFGLIWVLSLHPTPTERFPCAVVGERLSDPAAVGYRANCVSFTPVPRDFDVDDDNDRLSFLCGCNEGVVLEWELVPQQSNNKADSINAHDAKWEVLRHVLNPNISLSPLQRAPSDTIEDGGAGATSNCTSLSTTTECFDGPATHTYYYTAVGYDDGRVTVLRMFQEEASHQSSSPSRRRGGSHSIACVWYSVAFPGTWEAPTASAVTALHLTTTFGSTDDNCIQRVWCGSASGSVVVLDGHDGQQLKGGSTMTSDDIGAPSRIVQLCSYAVTAAAGEGDDATPVTSRDYIVWGASEDGRIIVFDPAVDLIAQEFPHPDTLAGVVVCPAASERHRHRRQHEEVWAVGASGFVLCLSDSDANSASLVDGDENHAETNARLQETCDRLGSLLDDTMAELKASQGERGRLLDEREKAQRVAVRVLKDAETHNRHSLSSAWADSLEILFVQFLLATSALEASFNECAAVRSERDHFRELLATASAPPHLMGSAAAPAAVSRRSTSDSVFVEETAPPSTTARSPLVPNASSASLLLSSRHAQQVSDLMLGRTLLDSPMEWTTTARSSVDLHIQAQQQLAAQQELHAQHNAQIIERDAQITQLQNELLRMRSDTDRHIDMAQQGYHRELQALRNIVQDQRRAADVLKDDITVKSSLLDDARKELRDAKDALRSIETQHKAAMEQLSHSAATQSAAEKRALTADLLASHVELQETQLAMQQLTKSHESERQRLQQDMLAMRGPWAAMKKSLHDAQVELALIKEQAARHNNQLAAGKDHQWGAPSIDAASQVAAPLQSDSATHWWGDAPNGLAARHATPGAAAIQSPLSLAPPSPSSSFHDSSRGRAHFAQDSFSGATGRKSTATTNSYALRHQTPPPSTSQKQHQPWLR